MDDRDLVSELVELIHSGFVFTDLMIEEGAPIVAKTPGGWEVIDSIPPVERSDLARILSKIDADWDETIAEHAINRPVDLTDWRLRINAYLAFGGEKIMMSIRKISSHPVPLKDTGLPESVRLMLDCRKGLILVSGSTGSGKSTSLAALVDAINESRSAHIITIEDPIEMRFCRKKAVFSQREIGVDVGSFFDGVRDAMRQRPDVIVIGEIRDKDTAETALLAAESGVLVIGTVHANDASGAVQKMLSFFNSQERDSKLQSLNSTLVGVISQMLMPSRDNSGWVLAAELLFNHKQQFSKVLGEPEKLASLLARKEDSISTTIADSLFDLIAKERVSKTEALRAVDRITQAVLMDKCKHLN